MGKETDMMNPGKSLATVLTAAALVSGLIGCQKKEATAEEKGPAEKAGQQLDQAAAKAGEQINKVAEQAGKGLQAAGEKIQNAAQEAKKKD
jgi:hypothetical protein